MENSSGSMGSQSSNGQSHRKPRISFTSWRKPRRPPPDEAPQTPPRVASDSTITVDVIDDQDGDRNQESPKAVADDGPVYDDFDESPQNMERLDRIQREARVSEERAKRAQEQFTSAQAPWRQYAERLAAWTATYLVNRRDVWGQYLPDCDRELGTALTMPPVKDRGHVHLTTDRVKSHYASDRVGDIIGLHSTSLDGTCKWVAWDIDHHDDDPNATDPAVNRANALKLYDELSKLGLHPLLTESNGNGGYHVRVIFDSPIASEVAYAFAQKIAELVPETVETFPKQAKLSGEKLGNWLRLPGYHHKREHFTKVWSGDQWLEGEAAIQAILSHEGDDSDVVTEEAAKYSPTLSASVPASAPTIGSSAVVNWLREILNQVPEEHFDEYKDWLRIGLVIHHEISDKSGLDLWDELSRKSRRYQDKACSKRWESFDDDDCDTRVTVGTLVHWIREHEPDYMPPPKPRADADEHGTGQKKNTAPIKITSWAERRKINPDPSYRPAVIHGLLRKCELATLISGPKMGKSWLAIQLALCVASGQRWLGLEVLKGRVLLVDCELHEETIEVRLKKVAEAMKIDIRSVEDKIDLVCLRGTGYTIRDVETKLLNQRSKDYYTLVVLDPMFKLFPEKASEGNDHDMRAMFDRLIHAAQTAGAALAVIHHATKGPQANKSTTDVGSGHGVLSRSPDVHITLLPEDEKSKDVVTHATLRATPRTFPPFKALHLERMSKEVPTWRLTDQADKSDTTSSPEGRDSLEAMRFVGICARAEPGTKTVIIGRHDHMRDDNDQKITINRAKQLFDLALGAGYLIECRDEKDQRRRLYRRDASAEEEHRRHQAQQLNDAFTQREDAEPPPASPNQ